MEENLNLKSWLKFDVHLNMLASLPDDTLMSLIQENQFGVLKMITYYFSPEISAENKLQMCIILQKFLKILPPDDKKKLISAGMPSWFADVIPAIIILLSDESAVNEALELLEILSEELRSITDRCCPNSFLENICNRSKYPSLILSLLQKGSPIWHRIWIALIKLLNQQLITMIPDKGTPLNSMLPIVETAFKMSNNSRCRAFLCWKELIDNLSKEINDNTLPRKMKLLMVPLSVNNAKAKETIQAKFATWWHLIIKFKPTLDNYVREIIIRFLHFCFGNHNSAEPLIPDHFTYELKMQCVEAFIELTGHVYCDGCTTIPKLNGKLLNTNYFLKYGKDWIHSLKSAILIIAQDIKENSYQQVKCMWKSFLLIIGELDENTLRKDIVVELLNEFDTLLKERYSIVLADIIFNCILLSLFDDEPRIKQHFKTIGKDNGLLKRSITFMVDDSFGEYYNSITSEEVVRRLKPVMDVLLNQSWQSTEHIIDWFLKIPVNQNTIILWTALAKSVSEFDTNICISELCNMLLWPLINMNIITDLKLPALAWYRMYATMYVKIRKTELNEQILNILLSSDRNSCLMLCACLAILKHDTNEDNAKCEQKVNLLQKLTKDLNDIAIKEMFPVLMDTLVILLDYVTNSVNENLTQNVLGCVKNILNSPDVLTQPQAILQNLLKSLKELFKVDSYSKHIQIIQKELQEFLSKTPELHSLTNVVNSVVYIPNANIESIDKDKLVTENFEKPAMSAKKDNMTDKNNFTKPQTRELVTKKKNCIVKTVIEDGEEYVVVKSDWKFNPKKLTENQKEKLQKKREDIPALYQDLSQSQDEFKSSLWKVDSQDTSNSSKSTKNEAISIISELKCSEIVPKISETMLMDNVEIDANELNENLPKVSKVKQVTTPKSDKSSRMAFKERVFRNVKMLTEKSVTPISNKTNTETEIHADTMATTPQYKSRNDNILVNSAPPLLLADRPTRVKRLPKKYDDTEIFALSKKLLNKEQSAVKCFEIDRASNQLENGITENVTCQDILKDFESMKNTVNVDVDKAICEKTKEKVSKLATECISNSAEIDNNNSEDMNVRHRKILKHLEVQNEKFVDNKVCDAVNTKEKKNDKPLPTQKLSEEITKEYSNVDDIVTSNNPDMPHGNKDHNKKLSTEIPQKTPKEKSKNIDANEVKSDVKKNSKISRIEKELAIDMVEDHIILKSDKRSTRKSIASTNVRKRTSLVDKLNKAKLDKTSTKTSKKAKINESSEISSFSEALDMLENCSDFSQGNKNSEDLSCSEDIIESSQDSALTAISITKKTPIKELVVKVNKITKLENLIQSSQEILQNSKCHIISTDLVEDGDTDITASNIGEGDPENLNKLVSKTKNNCEDLDYEMIGLPNKSNINESKNDTELPENKTAVEEKIDLDLTENMDTETFDSGMSNDVMLVDNEYAPIIISSEETKPGPETQEIAEADTQTIDPHNILGSESQSNKENNNKTIEAYVHESNNNESNNNTQDEVTRTMMESFDKHLTNSSNTDDASSPFKDDTLRKQDFLNNTSEISPIKIASPDRDKKSPSPETSTDYVVIKLSTPVQSNGEPFEKNESPEFFTEDKVSPDKRDQSPPRTEISLVSNNISPSSSLSLKKNRPQVRSGGRAAQMLGLCVPDKLNSIINQDRNESEEPKKSSPFTIPARRNLRLLYNSGADIETSSENEESENFLKFKRKLPTVESSPSGPILKRKLVDIEDETTISPVGKRKRVSFHDPPVSTTIAVQKYIEPSGLRSPQNSAQKRLDRQTRNHSNIKSPKRLETVFKLDSVLNRAVESFADVDILTNNTEDAQTISLEITPAIEIVRASELNDKDPICPLLIDCEDPIDNIAAKLSSTTTKSWLLKEFEGTIETIGDLAKMTELEVNRLCIKAPKVKTAKRVLVEYAAFLGKDQTVDELDNNILIEKNNVTILNDTESTVDNSDKTDSPENLPIDNNTGAKDDDTKMIEELPECHSKIDAEAQTFNTIINDASVQTVKVSLVQCSTQTSNVSTSHAHVQTNDSGEKKTADVIASLLAERSDQLPQQLDESLIKQLGEMLPLEIIVDLLMKRLSDDDMLRVMNRIFNNHITDKSKEIDFLIDFLASRCDVRTMAIICIKLLQKAHGNPT
ncbi:hypothetical protein K1T71_004035 [Dendrolimus kikuchii]|uniref:Uncharacterized protein n=1 Tax=Dendrolimus kikuchii TaxID=765133 RepID=A0ACC1DAF7_9NEOP|nr:hypothetical protein K1T71_004035 [Dendrolimus kikuchii]